MWSSSLNRETLVYGNWKFSFSYTTERKFSAAGFRPTEMFPLFWIPRYIVRGFEVSKCKIGITIYDSVFICKNLTLATFTNFLNLFYYYLFNLLNNLYMIFFLHCKIVVHTYDRSICRSLFNWMYNCMFEKNK